MKDMQGQLPRIDRNRAYRIFNSAQSSQLLDEEDHLVIFYDFKILDHRLSAVKDAFPLSAQHSVAIKTNPLLEVLKYISKRGFGLEAASYEECQLAFSAGANSIFWDSPAKTRRQILASTYDPGIAINADSIDDAKMIFQTGYSNEIGLRINPQTGQNAHESMSVAGQYSKFGHPISDRNHLIKFITSNPTIRRLHVHSSSQSKDLNKLSDGVRSVIDLANEINSSATNQIQTINIGGGLAVSYLNEECPTVEEYAAILKSRCPEIFDETYTVQTEFGRYYHANAGFTVSNVAQIKRIDSHQIAILHSGADLFLREAYNPGAWPHRIEIIGEKLEERKRLTTDLAGALCFGGDYLMKGVEIPELKLDDKVVILDTGANSFSLWSRHCSRSFPKVIGVLEVEPGQFEYSVIKERESIENIIKFWS